VSNFQIFISATPTGQLPILEIDGKKHFQSISLARYIAKENGKFIIYTKHFESSHALLMFLSEVTNEHTEPSDPCAPI
jgi:hypothetical protein